MYFPRNRMTMFKMKPISTSSHKKVKAKKELSRLIVISSVLVILFGMIFFYAGTTFRISTSKNLQDTEIKSEWEEIADNIFIGEVVEYISSETPYSQREIAAPYNQYRVSVKQNLKGDSPDVLIISLGGRNYSLGMNSLIDTPYDNEVLQEGAMYLFLTRPNTNYDHWYDIIHIQTEPGYGYIAVKNTQHEEQLIKQIMASIVN